MNLRSNGGVQQHGEHVAGEWGLAVAPSLSLLGQTLKEKLISCTRRGFLPEECFEFLWEETLEELGVANAPPP